MRQICITFIKQHRFFSDAFLNSRDDQSLLALYVETLAETESA
jgi:hypothetical protein